MFVRYEEKRTKTGKYGLIYREDFQTTNKLFLSIFLLEFASFFCVCGRFFKKTIHDAPTETWDPRRGIDNRWHNLDFLAGLWPADLLADTRFIILTFWKYQIVHVCVTGSRTITSAIGAEFLTVNFCKNQLVLLSLQLFTIRSLRMVGFDTLSGQSSGWHLQIVLYVAQYECVASTANTSTAATMQYSAPFYIDAIKHCS